MRKGIWIVTQDIGSSEAPDVASGSVLGALLWALAGPDFFLNASGATRHRRLQTDPGPEED